MPARLSCMPMQMPECPAPMIAMRVLVVMLDFEVA
jgi:hypothetical protein